MLSKIMTLLGCSASAAGTILLFIDAASIIGLVLALTGIGITAASAIIGYRWLIKKVAMEAGKQAAIAL